MTIALGVNVDGRGRQIDRPAGRTAREPPCRAPTRWTPTSACWATRWSGDRTLFAREDYVEEAWRIVDPVLKADTPVYDYEPGTWGPKETDQRVAPLGGWNNPTVL